MRFCGTFFVGNGGCGVWLGKVLFNMDYEIEDDVGDARYRVKMWVKVGINSQDWERCE